MQPPRLTAGRAVAAATAGVALILIAFLFDAAPLFVPGVAFVLLGGAAPAWVWISARGARAQRRLPDERVIEDEPLEATIEISRGPLGLPGAEVYDPFTGTRTEVAGLLSAVLGVNSVKVAVTARFPRRGLKTLDPPSLHVRDPLDLATVEAVGAGPPQRLLVLPRTERVQWLMPDRGRRFRLAEGNAASDAMAAVDVDGLRPYRPGTPASRIHWPAVARGAGLIERRLQADGDSRPMIVLDARGDGPPELLDAAVRAVASLTLELARAGGCGLLLPGEQRATGIDRELISWPAAYARLAVVEGGPEAPAPALKSYATRVGPMIYVAAETPGRLPSAASAAARGLTALVVPVDALAAGRPPGVRGPLRPMLNVSGCRGFLLGVGRDVERPRADDHEESAA